MVGRRWNATGSGVLFSGVSVGLARARPMAWNGKHPEITQLPDDFAGCRDPGVLGGYFSVSSARDGCVEFINLVRNDDITADDEVAERFVFLCKTCNRM